MVGVLKDKDVDSLSSFVGIDGTNTTLNNGRYLINLKPKGERSGNIQATMTRLSNAARNVSGIRLYLQPVQDLTIDSTVGRAAYQFILGAANAATLTRLAALSPRAAGVSLLSFRSAVTTGRR